MADLQSNEDIVGTIGMDALFGDENANGIGNTILWTGSTLTDFGASSPISADDFIC